MNATHFRQRAAHAREMAQSGDDLRLAKMLLDVALDLDAEAEAIEAEMLMQLRRMPLTDRLGSAAGTGCEAG